MKHWAGIVVLATLTGCGLFQSVSPTPGVKAPADVVFIPERPAIGETFTLQLRSVPGIAPFPDGTYEVTFQEVDQSGSWNFFAPKTPPLKRLPPDEPHLAATIEVKDGFGSVEIPLTATVPNQWGESFEVVPGKWVGVSIRTDQRGTSRGFLVRER